MSYDIQPFGSIFLNNNDADVAINDNSYTGVKKKKRRKNKKKALKRAQAEAERREYDMWVVAMYKKNKEEQRLKEKEDGLRNLIVESVSDSNSKFNLKYNNPIPPPQRAKSSNFMSGKSVISKGRIERTRDPNSCNNSSGKTGNAALTNEKELEKVNTSPIMKNNKKKKADIRDVENVEQNNININNDNKKKQALKEDAGIKTKRGGDKTSTHRRSHRGLPFSKAKELAKETLAEEVTQLKNRYNLLKLKRLQLTKVFTKKSDVYRSNLKIENSGIQYDELSYSDALSPKATISRMLHEILINRVTKFLYSFYQGTPPITILDDILDEVVGHSYLHIETPKRFTELLFSGMSMDEIVSRKSRECLSKLSSNTQRWEAQLEFMLDRESVFKSRMSKQIEDFNHHISKNKEDIKITKSNYWDIMKQFDQLKIEDAKLQKLIVKNRKKYHLVEARLAAEVKDSAMWTAEIQRMSNRRDRVAKMFRDDLQAKQMAKEAKEQEVKEALLKAKKDAEEKRLRPYKNAAMKIFHATGVSDVDKVLELFENQEGRFENLTNLIEQKEQQLEHFLQEVNRLKRLLEQSKLIGSGGVSTGDEKRLGIDIYNSKLKEAVDESNKEKSRAHFKFVTKRDGLIGLTACAKRLGIEVQSVQLDEDPLTKFVMPRRKRRSSIVNRSPARSSAKDLRRLKVEKAQIAQILQSIEDKMTQLLNDVLKNLKANNKNDENSILPSETSTPSLANGDVLTNIDEDNSKLSRKSNSKASSKAPSRSGSISGGIAKSKSRSSSISINRNAEDTNDTNNEEENANNRNAISAADLQLIQKSMKLLPERESTLNVRIKKRNCIVTEYVDATGKMQYAYTYLSEEEEDDSDDNNILDTGDDNVSTNTGSDMQAEQKNLMLVESLHHKNQRLLHTDAPDDANTDWKAARKEQRLHSQSITKIYAGRVSSGNNARQQKKEEDASDLISFSSIVDREFKNLHSEADYTKHALHYEDEVTSISNAARRQTGKWREKIELQKSAEKLKLSAKHHSKSIRNRYAEKFT
eukprot:g1604.t1